MANLAEKIAAVEKQKRALLADIAVLREGIDELAEKGDTEGITTYLGDIAAREQMLASCDRRIQRLQGETTEAARGARREANLEAVGIIESELAAALMLAGEVDSTLDQLFSLLRQMAAHGEEARAAFSKVIVQLPRDVDRERQYPVSQAIGLLDDFVGNVIESRMQSAGLFGPLAPSQGMNPRRLDFAHLAEEMATRVDRLTKAAAKLATSVNEAI